MIEKIFYLTLIPSCIGIAIIDHILFSEWLKCEKCGYKPDKPWSFLLPSILEILFFLAGIGIGVVSMS